MHGQGVYQWVDGRRYVGQYRNDKKEGFGVYYWLDGRRYEGEWQDGKRNGPGKMIYPDGTEKHGYWVDDKRDTETEKRITDLPHSVSSAQQKQTSPIKPTSRIRHFHTPQK